MDGETALKFSRSRNAEGEEGTDFAREKRQQKMLEAVKNKLINLIKKPNLKTYQKLYGLIDKLVKRDITNQQAAIIFKNIVLKGSLNQGKITLEEEFFINPPLDSAEYDGLWVLVPSDKTYSLIHQYIECRLKDLTNCNRLKNKSSNNQ